MLPAQFRDLITSRPLVLDGGMATLLEEQGEDISGSLWSARVLRDNPQAVEAAHVEYLAAGAQVLITASYQVSRRGLVAVGGTPTEADRLLSRSVELARQARDRHAPDALVAASVGPWGATNHDGSEYRGRYGISVAELTAFHRERLEVLVAAGPDLLAVETIPDSDEVEALALALADSPVAAWISLTTPTGTTTSAGQPLREVAQMLAECEPVVAVGVNCCAPESVASALSALSVPSSTSSLAGPSTQPTGDRLALVAYPNAGQTWNASTEQWSGPSSPEFAESTLATWLDGGARLVGGCCGVGPRGIAGIAAVLSERS